MAAGSPDKPVSVDDRHKALEAMAVARFDHLTPGEQKLLRAVVEGQMADLSPGVKEPPEPEVATPEQKVRARLLRWLLTDREAQALFEKSEVFLFGALIEDELDLEYADVPVAILLQNCRITKPIVLRHARTRTLYLGGCCTAGIEADGIHIQGACFLHHGFVANEVARLPGAKIRGSLVCSRGTFRSSAAQIDGGTVAASKVLNLDGAIVDGYVFLDDGFISEGEVWLLRAKIGGALDCQGGTFRNTDGLALCLDGVVVDMGVFLNNGFTSDGEVRMVAAKVGGSLECKGSTFRNTAGRALCLDKAVIEGDVILGDGFTSEGEVRLAVAKIGGNLICTDSHFINNDGDAFCADRAHIKRAFLLRGVEVEGDVDLTSMSVRTLADEANAWPDRIELGNFRYDEIFVGSPLDARTRIDWLTRQPSPRDLDPQPWRHLAAVLRKQGHEDDARKVMIEYWWRRTRRESPKWMQGGRVGAFLHWCALTLGFVMRHIERALTPPMRVLFGAIIGHGYARWRAFVWLLFFWFIGALVFGWNCRDPIHTPMKESQPLAMRSRIAIAAINAQIADAPPPDRLAELEQARLEHAWVETRYPAFNRWVYSLDTLLPIADFRQETYWTPKDGWRRSFFLPFQIATGWVVTTLFVVSFTGLVRRGDE